MILSCASASLVRTLTRSLVSTLVLLVVLPGNTAMAIEEPRYQVQRQVGDIEIREYAPYLVAETLIAGEDDRDAAASEGFRRLFRYISGNNSAADKIAMTAPVLQSPTSGEGQKIDMTVPVQQTPTDAGWRVAFVLPKEFSLQTAPVPNDPRIGVRQTGGRVMAVIRFAGRWSEANYIKHRDALLAFLHQENLEAVGEAKYAAYNAPFTLPFMRRNEVMVEISPGH
jgi:hypothetical protein